VRVTGAPGPPEGPGRLAEFALDPGPENSASPADGRAAGYAAAAALTLRALAAAADLAAAVLGVSLPIVLAAALRGRWPTPAGLLWAAAFGVSLSFSATVAALFLFGRTPGMALCGLGVRSDAAGVRPTAGQAARRFLGTLLSAGTLGVPLLLTRRDRAAPTPADRLSGRPLVEDGS
jgi:uncharacterized RDD family membrane protein YckC